MKRKEYDHSKLQGRDVDLEISLKEYGFAWIETEEEYLFYYGIDFKGEEYIRFDFCSFPKNMDIREEFAGVKDENWKSISDMTEYDIFDMDLHDQIYELVRYYGNEEIFGSSYYEGLTFEEVLKP